MAIVTGLAMAGAFAFGMTRREKTEASYALDHPLRRRILEALTRRPGHRVKEIGTLVNAAPSTTLYHLFVLERVGYLQSIRREGSTRYFPNDLRDPDGWAVLLRGRVLDMASAIFGDPGASQKQLLAALSLSRKVFRDYADLLVAESLVREEKAWRSRRYFPLPRLEQIVRDARGRTETGADHSPDASPPSEVEARAK